MVSLVVEEGVELEGRVAGKRGCLQGGTVDACSPEDIAEETAEGEGVDLVYAADASYCATTPTTVS